MDRRLLILALGMFSLGTDSFVVAGVLPQIAHTYDVSIGAAGQMTTVYAISYALLAPTLAAVAATVPRRKMLLWALSIFVLANLGTALAPTFGIALLTRAIAGLGAAMFAPTATGAAAMIVPPERRGFALSVVVAGLTGATALGSPLGALIGGLGDWRWTMAFVAAVGAIAALGIYLFLHAVPMPPAVSLRKRLQPLADARIGLTLGTTLLSMAGQFTVYTYFALVFDKAIGGSPIMLSVLLVLWGTAGTITNLVTGRLLDRIGARKVLITMLSLLIIVLTSLPWAATSAWTGVIAVILWGACGWGVLVPQQHRLVELAPNLAPVVLGLNNASTYIGVSVAGVVGAAGVGFLGAHQLGYIGAGLVATALLLSELASRRIAATTSPADVKATASA